MNIHHLELFYHVARCAGVSAAARQMPYGIQQPAISAQILQLEDHLGKVLFRRRPFELTREGEILFEFIAPFFDGLPAMGERLRGGAENHLRIAAPGIVQRDYLPRLLAAVSERIEGFRFSLQSGRVNEIEARLRTGEIDLGLATVAGPLGPGVHFRPLLSLRLELLVAESGEFDDSEEILSCDRIDLPLIALPASQPPCRLFQEELQRRGIAWLPSLELENLELVSRYVAEGYGVGLSLNLPGSSWQEGVRALPLPGFPEVSFGALSIDPALPLVDRFADEAEKVAEEMMRRP